MSAYERGHRSPSVALLSKLLAAAGCQLKVELEPLGADIDNAVRRALAASAEERADQVAYPLTELAAALAERPYVVTGLAAAALQGAPVEVPIVEISVGDDDEILGRVCRWIRPWGMRVWDDEVMRWVLADPSPSLLRTLTPTRWVDCLDREYVLAVVEASQIQPDVQVSAGDASIPAIGLWRVEATDEHVAAVLTRTRELSRGRD